MGAWSPTPGRSRSSARKESSLLSVRIRQHVNPLKSDFFGIPLEALALPAGAPVEVELGSAEAWFLMDRAREVPYGHYVGVEIRRELAWEANEASTNVRRLTIGISC